MQRDDVAGAKQVLERDHGAAGTMVIAGGRGGDDIEAEGTCSRNHGASDAAESHQSKCEAREPPQRWAGGQVVTALFCVEMEKGGFSDGRQQQSDRMVGNFGDAVVGDISDGDASQGAGFDRNIVQSDAEPRDNPAISGGVYDPRGDLCPAGGDGVDSRGALQQSGFAGVGGLKDIRPHLEKHVSLDLAIGPRAIGDQHLEAVGHLCALRVGCSEFGHPDGWLDDPIPVLSQIVVRPALFRNGMSHVDRLDHFDRIPRTDQQFVRVGFLGGDVDTDLATDATFHVDLAPGLEDRNGGSGHLVNTIDRANLQARLTTGAVVGVDDRHFLGQFLTGASLGHGREPFVRIPG